MGNIHQVEVVIHVDEALTDDQRTTLLSNLSGHEGVAHARFTAGRNKLHSIDILNYIKQENVTAELVGI